MTPISDELIKFIQTFPRSKEGYMFIHKTCYKEDDADLLKFLNTMYNKNEKITFEILKKILVSEEQETEYFYSEQEVIERKLEKRDRRIETKYNKYEE